MMTIILIYLAASVVSIGFITFLMKSSPTGWEDENSFHMEMKRSVKLSERKISIMRKSIGIFSKQS
jgi:hypothetical protein